MVIAIPVCSAIHKFPSSSKIIASGDARDFSGVNSVMSLFFGLINPILPDADSVNQIFPSLSIVNANGSDSLAGSLISSNVSNSG